MQDINVAHANIEVTGNFLIGKTLSTAHYEALAELLENVTAASHNKGAIYLSPIKDSPHKRELLPRYFEIKNRSQLPAFIYLIQRL
jgi:hypothetical protein